VFAEVVRFSSGTVGSHHYIIKVHTFPFLIIVSFLYFQRSAYNQYVVRSSP